MAMRCDISLQGWGKQHPSGVYAGHTAQAATTIIFSRN